MLNNNNEDKGNLNGVYQIYRNVFIGPGAAIYQGSTNDGGDVDSNNTWAVFSNTFVNTKVDFGASFANGYNIYVRNNVFANTKVQMPAKDSAVHALSNNGWFGSATSYNGKAPKGFGITADPALDSAHNVTSAAYVNAGVAGITPQTTMSSSATHPLGYKAGKPDIGMNER